MPNPINLTDVYQVTLWTQLGNQAVLNLLHYKVTAIVGSPTMEGVVDDLAASLGAIIKPMLSNIAIINGIILKKLIPALSVPVLSSNIAVAGDIVDTPMANQGAGVITKLTNLPGRAGRGRLYIGGLPEQATTDGLNLTPAAQARQVTAAGLLLVPITSGPAGNTAEFTPVLYHRLSNTVSDVTSLKSRAYIASQRRRGGTGRPNVSPF